MPTALLPPQLVIGAAAPLPAIARAANGTQLDAPTPCAEWDFAALARHVIYWSPLLAAAGRRTTPTPPAASEAEVALDDVSGALEAAWIEVVEAWSDPVAWTGSTSLGGPDPMPADVIGGMVVGELVVHGWDLAKAAGVVPQWSDDVIASLHDAAAGMAQQGREMGIFGPEVPVPADSPVLDRVLAITGRDPRWTR
jgi:uncharacterized protein (TIGR03086 family)